MSNHIVYEKKPLKKKKILLSTLFVFVLFIAFYSLSTREMKIPQINRADIIPSDVIKGTPLNDEFPPILHSDEYQDPIPLELINTAGAEDSPFLSAERNELYFFFTKDVRETPQEQIKDPANGIWVSKKLNGSWGTPQLVMLQKPNKMALNGCTFVHENEMFFCTTREGYTGLHWFSAEFKNGRWKNWKENDFNPDFEVGEFHIHKNKLYYHSLKDGGLGKNDIWSLTKIDGQWINPTNLKTINSNEHEMMPYLTPDGKELWFNRTYKGSPAIFRSKKLNDEWQEPELIISQFAGEPSLDKEGNIYFVHHFYKKAMMIEADIYVAYKK